MTPSSVNEGNNNNGSAQQADKLNIVQVLLNILLVLAVTAALLGWPGCSSQEEEFDPEMAKIQHKRKVREDAIRAANEEPPPPKPGAGHNSFIKTVHFAPIRIPSGTEMKVKIDTIDTPEDADILFAYTYWKNGEKIPEFKGDTLPPTAYKKNDIVYADVEFYLDGQLAEKVRTEMFVIPNSSPVIEEVQIPQITGAGAYTLALKCKDNDGDQIKYSLLPIKDGGTVWSGLSINSASGNVTLTLTEEPPPPLQLKFIISADDGDGGVTKKNVSINFQTQKAIKKVPVKEEEGEEGESDGTKP